MEMTKNLVVKLTLVFMLFKTPLVADEKVSKGEPEPDQRAEIEKRAESYVAAYNAKDVQALSAHWTSDGVYIDRHSGQRIAGGAELEKVFQAEQQGVI